VEYKSNLQSGAQMNDTRVCSDSHFKMVWQSWMV